MLQEKNGYRIRKWELMYGHDLTLCNAAETDDSAVERARGPDDRPRLSPCRLVPSFPLPPPLALKAKVTPALAAAAGSGFPLNLASPKFDGRPRFPL